MKICLIKHIACDGQIIQLNEHIVADEINDENEVKTQFLYLYFVQILNMITGVSKYAISDDIAR